MKYRMIPVIIFAILMLVLSSASGAQNTGFKCSECHESAKEVLPKKHIKKEKFDTCFDCHKEGKQVRLNKKIHKIHIMSMGSDLETCMSCHQDVGDGMIIINSATGQKVYADEVAAVAGSLYTKGTLANSHVNAGLSCTNCHIAFDYDEYDTMGKKCITCHGDYPEVAKRTANTGYETNPHKSHFPNLSCNKCHSMHGQFKDYCSQKCHKWDFDWKQKLKN